MRYLDRYTWKQKNQWLGIGLGLFVLLVYPLCLKKTIVLHQEVQARAVSAGEQKMITDELSMLTSTVAQRSGFLAAGEQEGRVVEPDLLSVWAGELDLEWEEIKNSEQFDTETARLIYTRYQLRGAFIGHLQLLHRIEQDSGLLLVHANFKKKVSYNSPPKLVFELTTVRVAPLVDPTNTGL